MYYTSIKCCLRVMHKCVSGDSEKPSQFSATPECKHECGLPNKAVLHSKKNKGCLSSEEQSPFGLQSLFSQQSIEKSVECGALASATVHAENGFDELKYGHVKCSLKKTHVSEPFSQLDTNEDTCTVSQNDDCMFISQQDNGIEGINTTFLFFLYCFFSLDNFLQFLQPIAMTYILSFK